MKHLLPPLSLLLALLPAGAFAVPGSVSADFSGGSGNTGAYQVPGIGGAGWAGPWTTGNLSAATIAFDAASTPELAPGAGVHLRASISGVNADSGVGRSFSTVDHLNGIDVTKPITLQFDFRLEASTSGFSSSTEYVTLTGNNNLVSSSGSSTWILQIAGGASPRWACYNGNRDSGSFSSSRLVDTGLAAVAGTTYSVTIALDPAARTWSATLSDGVTTVSRTGLGFRTSATTVGNMIGFFGKKNAAGDTLAFSVDRLSLSGERPPSPPEPLATLPYVFDMVSHNPGEAYYDTAFNDPTFTRGYGYTGKVYSLFESPMLAVNWDEFDTPDKVILPVGSADRAWVDAKRAEVASKITAAKAAGLEVYAMSDLILLPKRIVSLHGLSTTLGDISNPDTELWLRRNLRLAFEQFPGLDGLMVRIGETYLNDAPYHQGRIDNPWSTATITPLMNILRDEVCVKQNKRIFFRTWNSFDTNLTTFLAVSNAVEPHPNLIWSIKHVEGDFHRGNPWSKVLGQGRHPYIVEVQCAREYEGKGASPNYIAAGVIDGFEEHAASPSQKLRQLWQTSPLLRGVWTWSRGGGWRGPYIRNELWCELNAWVMTQWALAPATSEAILLDRFATEKLGLPSSQLADFRRLCLLSAEAIWRWKRGTNNGLVAGWSRDQYYTFPNLPASAASRAIILTSQDEAVARFEEIVAIARTLTPADPADGEFIRSSSEYGLRLLRFLRCVVQLEAAEVDADPFRIKVWMDRHDEAWASYLALAQEFPDSASTLYVRNAWQTWGGENPTSAEPRLRSAASAAVTTYSAQDSDADGLSDATELGLYWDQPFDTNGDGTPDYQQAAAKPRPYDFWRQSQFGRAFDNPALAAPEADPEADGHANLLEFALGGNALVPGPSLANVGMHGSPPSPGIEFSPNAAGTDIVLAVESSNTLSSWTPVARSAAGAPWTALLPDWSVEPGTSPGSIRVLTTAAAPPVSLFLRVAAQRVSP